MCSLSRDGRGPGAFLRVSLGLKSGLEGRSYHFTGLDLARYVF